MHYAARAMGARTLRILFLIFSTSKYFSRGIFQHCPSFFPQVALFSFEITFTVGFLSFSFWGLTISIWVSFMIIFAILLLLIGFSSNLHFLSSYFLISCSLTQLLEAETSSAFDQ